MLWVEIFKNVLQNQTKLYFNNYDFYRFGRLPWKKKLRVCIEWILIRLRVSPIKRLNQSIFSFNQMVDYVDDFDFLYMELENNESKSLLVDLLSYRILGGYRYKLKTNNAAYWQAISKIAKLKKERDFIVTSSGRKLFLFDIRSIGYDIDIFYHPKGIVTDFVLRQYEYLSDDGNIKANANDIVIDAGGCFGDTALYFASIVGKKGRVYSFEFIPQNLNILYQNIERNPHLKEIIYIKQHPLWSGSDTKVFFKDEGPGSKVTFEFTKDYEVTHTLSIDDFFAEEKLDRIDFIKMDIEGAELEALKGAKDVIQKFRPKLAISVYHSINDFALIPRYILELNPNYKLFLGHFTIHAEETVLFALDNTKL